MEPESRDNPRLLRKESSAVSDFSMDSSTTFVPSPTSSATYQHTPSLAEQDTSYRGLASSPPPDAFHRGNTIAQGLAIKNLTHRRQSSVSQPLMESEGSPSLPGSANPLLTLSPAAFDVKSSTIVEDFEEDPVGHRPLSIHEPFAASPDTERLNTRAETSTIRSFDPSVGSHLDYQCRSRRNIHQGRGNWLSITLMILAIYSSVFSGIWLLIALIRPRYGRHISSTGKFAPATASLLCAAFAKTIELSFVTVFVAFLGQVLSRRAFRKKSKGLTIAEMAMRTWVMQPGTMITHFESLRYAGATFLGMIALTATLCGMLYTTGSDALVAPKLKFGKTESRLLYGQVSTSFANPTYIENHCQTPIQAATDPINYGATCVEIEHAGQAYHNYLQWLSTWTIAIAQGNGTADLASRPKALAMLYDNTTVQGSWINVQNMTELSQNYGRVVNNVSMAMPHAGVFAAGRDPTNNIMQAQDLSGLGEYYIEASVTSPVVNVLCASVTEEEMAPLVYTSWPGSNGAAFNATLWPNGYDVPTFPSFLNSTPMDDLFLWGEKYNRRPPVFPKFPIAYNSVLNTTGWHADTIYLLATSADSTYMLCSLRASQSPNCSTKLYSSASGASMESHCDDAHNELAYSKSEPKANSGIYNQDWVNVASEWALALSMDAGITDGDASNVRLLTQMIPSSNSLDPSLPSIAEALAVLAGCTLLISSQDSPFIHYWNYSATVSTLAEPQYQGFNATLKTQDYSSGGTQHWQGIFYIVLLLVFATNVFCLVYFIVRGGLVTDFVEPQNLFSLSLNSPPSQSLAGSCGGGPEREELNTNWFINMDNDHVYIQSGDRSPTGKGKRSKTIEFDFESSPLASTYSKLSKKHTSLL